MQYSPQYDVDKGLIGYPNLDGVNAGDLDLDRLHETSKGQDRSVSVFATASYSYKDRYVVAGSSRWDGADIIGTDNRFSPLWNVSLKWNSFFERIVWIYWKYRSECLSIYFDDLWFVAIL